MSHGETIGSRESRSGYLHSWSLSTGGPWPSWISGACVAQKKLSVGNYCVQTPFATHQHLNLMSYSRLHTPTWRSAISMQRDNWRSTVCSSVLLKISRHSTRSLSLGFSRACASGPGNHDHHGKRLVLATLSGYQAEVLFLLPWQNTPSGNCPLVTLPKVPAVLVGPQQRFCR